MVFGIYKGGPRKQPENYGAIILTWTDVSVFSAVRQGLIVETSGVTDLLLLDSVEKCIQEGHLAIFCSMDFCRPFSSVRHNNSDQKWKHQKKSGWPILGQTAFSRAGRLELGLRATRRFPYAPRDRYQKPHSFIFFNGLRKIISNTTIFSLSISKRPL